MNERAGTPAQPSDLIDVDALRRAYYELKPDVTIPEQRVVFGTSRPPRLVAEHRLQRGPHRRDHAGDRRVPRQPGHHRAAVHRRGHPRCSASPPRRRRSRCWSATRCGCWSTSSTTTCRRPPCRTRSSAYNRARAMTTRPTASSSRRATTRRATAASSTTRRTAARPTRDATSWIANRANEIIADGMTRGADGGADAASRPTTSAGTTSTTSTNIIDIDGDQGQRASASAPTRSAARACTTGRRSPNATSSTSPS